MADENRSSNRLYDHYDARKRHSEQRLTMNVNRNLDQMNRYHYTDSANNNPRNIQDAQDRYKAKSENLLTSNYENTSGFWNRNSQSHKNMPDLNYCGSSSNQGQAFGPRQRKRNGGNQSSGSEAWKDKPIYAITKSQLNDLTKQTPSNAILALVGDRSGFLELLNQNEIAVDVVALLANLLSTVMVSKIHKESQNHLITTLLGSKFFTQHVPKFISNNGKRSSFDQDIFIHIGKLCNIIAEKMPDTALEELPLCIDICVESLRMRDRMKLPVSPEAKQIISSVQTRFLELTKHRETSKQLAELSDENVLQDFREIDVIPTIDEIMTNQEPLLRPIITKGQYKDTDHYLDTHFRLMQEDFIQPLRKGITEYLGHESKSKKHKMIKLNDVRVYEDVQILESHFDRNGVIYSINVNENSFKKAGFLIYGSLVCLSADQFKTALFATVSNIPPSIARRYTFDDDYYSWEYLDMLNIIFVKFETQSRLTADKFNLSYTMVESQAYFEAYKHTLHGLQSIDASSLPLQNYIIGVQKNLEPPLYLKPKTIYNISCILPHKSTLSSRCKKSLFLENSDVDDSNIESCKLHHEDSTLESCSLNLCKCHIQVQNLNNWPSSDELCMDDVQRKAFHLALSSAMTIIQGPPGTGKTYLGLKIVKVLLNNCKVWRMHRKTPILVVCYTNHALDQFLEGMLSFTKRLVRVGSRSQNEKLEEFNIRRIRRIRRKLGFRIKSYFCDGWLEYSKYSNIAQLRYTLQTIQGEWEEIKSRFDLFGKKIIHENSLHILSKFGENLSFRLLNDFKQNYIQDGVIEKEWKPDSLLSSWLGLDLYGWVDEAEINNFIDEDISQFQIEESQNKVRTRLTVGQTKGNSVKETKPLLKIENIRTIEENRRILDTDIEEELLPIYNKTQSMLWALDVEALNDPSTQICHEELQDPGVYEKYCMMAKNRQYIAVRELQKHDVMDKSEAKKEMQFNLWNMNLNNRWRLYRLIIKKFIQVSEDKCETLKKNFKEITKRMHELENGEDLDILADSDVVGMTTTGAAKNHELLQALNPTIVIVEEAAEVLESHIVTSLAPETQHLILIGDHQQLRPNTTVYTLAKNYHLDVSLFERMINNGVHYETLKIQHRMRPEISGLLVPLIYDSLEDHPSVKQYPAIKGTASSLYFITHSVKEDELVASKTHSNKFEAEYLVAFCEYLLLQGYSSEKITILTTYAGQLHTFEKLMKKEIFEGFRVSTVDNFQGEENDIILLSFVRSNDDGKIGFLNIENRVNVALSRARHGMFCIGNFRLFAAKSKLWHRLVANLECQQLIGDGVEIVCQNHSDAKHKIVKPDDFQKCAPEGGCRKICGEMLPCQHNCRQFCHLMEHKCQEPCPKVLCELGHVCPLLCCSECKPCNVKVERILPKCQHIVQLACHIDPEDYDCQKLVERRLPHCKHLSKMSCFMDPNGVTCLEPCLGHLKNCEHQCTRFCHPLHDPDHLFVKCINPCSKVICDRNHTCQMLCYEKCNKCQMLVTKSLPCGHSAEIECQMPPELHGCIKKCIRILSCGHMCPRRCKEKCGGCNEMVVKTSPSCSHSIQVSCSTDLNTVVCSEPCSRSLPCGHPCQGKCGELCDLNKCSFNIHVKANCGHNVEVPCHSQDTLPEILSRNCSNPCNKVLPNCGHMCTGTCGRCRQGRLHIACKEKCERRLLCGHACTLSCAEQCPQCKEKCQYKCKHFGCKKLCRQLCDVCGALCSWNCDHKKCNNYCTDLCDREPCNEPCPKHLVCGHPCVGLCGELCPPLCRICNFEELAKFNLCGIGIDENTRFVYLPDCKHTIEVGEMDNWMNMKATETAEVFVQMKCCPRCQMIIWECPRYGNMIKSTFQDMQKAKKDLLDSHYKQRSEMTRLQKVLQTHSSIPIQFKSNYEQLRRKLAGKQNLSHGETTVIEKQIHIINRMAEMKDELVKMKVCEMAKTYADKDFELLIQRLYLNKRLNDFEVSQFINEIDRIMLYVEILNVQNQVEIFAIQSHPKQYLDKVKDMFTVGNILDKETAMSIKDHLETAIEALCPENWDADE